jgi:hypothetical protein
MRDYIEIGNTPAPEPSDEDTYQEATTPDYTA